MGEWARTGTEIELVMSADGSRKKGILWQAIPKESGLWGVSRESTIDFTFESPVDIRGAVRALRDAGVEFDREGVSYFVNSEDDLYDWIRVDSAELGATLSLIESSWASGTVSGVTVGIQGSERGGELLFFPERSAVTFSASVNKEFITESSGFADLGWYCKVFIPIFESFGLAAVSSSDF
ncbi:hypothetical protein ABZ901_04180 [Actinacidiphila alni]|uniref:hypothetical protein n=1 Tax=Actinacidiphila alni TaxID=380248 RepID=UPI0033F253ED